MSGCLSKLRSYLPGKLGGQARRERLHQGATVRLQKWQFQLVDRDAVEREQCALAERMRQQILWRNLVEGRMTLPAGDEVLFHKYTNLAAAATRRLKRCQDALTAAAAQEVRLTEVCEGVELKEMNEVFLDVVKLQEIYNPVNASAARATAQEIVRTKAKQEYVADKHKEEMDTFAEITSPASDAEEEEEEIKSSSSSPVSKAQAAFAAYAAASRGVAAPAVSAHQVMHEVDLSPESIRRLPVARMQQQQRQVAAVVLQP